MQRTPTSPPVKGTGCRNHSGLKRKVLTFRNKEADTVAQTAGHTHQLLTLSWPFALQLYRRATHNNTDQHPAQNIVAGAVPPCMEGLSVSVRCFGGNWIRHRADRSPISRGHIHT